MDKSWRYLLLGAALAFGGAAAAQEGERPAPSILRIGVVSPDGSGRAIPGLGEIRRAFTQATGLEVRVFVARDTASLIEAQAGGRVHYAIHSAAGYAAAQALCGCVEPLVAPVGSKGDVGLRAVIYARDGMVGTLADAARLRVVAGPARGLGPQHLALEALAEAGAGDDVILADSQEEAEVAFTEGRADVLVGWEQDFEAGSIAGPDPLDGTAARLAAAGMKGSAFEKVWTSDLLRYGPHVVRADLAADTKASLRTFLTYLHAQSPLLYDRLEGRHLGGFVAVTQADYAAAEALVAAAR